MYASRPRGAPSWTPAQLGGLVYAQTFSDFDADGIAGQYGTNAIIGVSGTGAGADTSDPTVVAEGAELDGGDYFQSIGQASTFAHVENTCVFTIVCAFLEPATRSGAPVLLDTHAQTGSKKGFDLRLTVAGLALYITDSVAGVVISCDIGYAAAPGWHKVVIIGDGVNVRSYLDGAATPTATTSVAAYMASAHSGPSTHAAAIGTRAGQLGAGSYTGKLGLLAVSNQDASGSRAEIESFTDALMATRGVTLP